MWIGIDGRVLQEEKFGGVKEYAKRLISALLKLDAKNQYVIFTNKWGKENNLDLPPLPNLRLAAFGYPNKFLNLSLLFFDAPRLDTLLEKEVFKQMGQKIKLDIFWAPNLNFIRLRPGTKFFLTVHDISFLIEPSFFSLKERLWHALISPKKLFRQVDTFLPVSSYTAGELARMGFRDINTEIIKPGIDQKFFETSEEEVAETRREYGLPERFILALAAKGKRKNLEGAIKAFKMARLSADLHLVIAGEGTEVIGRDNRIIGLGAVSEEARRALYKGAEFFVYPSFYEGFGLPVVEAMASGTPVITSAAASMPEAGNGASVLVNPHDKNEIIAAMEALSASSELRAKLKDAGRLAASKFSWEDSALKLMRLFEK